MSQLVSARLEDHFAELTDPRRREVLHPLINMVTIAICAVLSGADDFVAIAAFGEARRDWFAKFLDLSNGIPSHDCFNRTLGALKPAEFEKCLLSWISSLHEATQGRMIAVDGKTLRGSYDAASSKSAIHMVSAWSSAHQISLGQVITDAKSNEITAIPELLRMLEISGTLVTIDAMGCQTEIAQTIVDADADYCLAVKGNQPTLENGIAAFFDEHLDDDFAQLRVRHHATSESNHGRREQRYYYLCQVPNDLPGGDRWPGLKAIGLALNVTERHGESSSSVRYYILSRFLSGRRFADAVRGHWSIENQLHWQLDVTFGEDKSRIRQGHADANFSILRRTALSMLKNDTSFKIGIKNKRLRAAWDTAYLEKLLRQK